MLLRQLAPPRYRHRGGRDGVDALSNGLAIGLVRPNLVRVSGRMADLDGIEAPHSATGLAWWLQARDFVNAISSVTP
jgi:hypothetical protein